MRSLISSWYGKDDPDHLVVGEIYALFSAGKDRKRSLMKPLQNPLMKKGRDPARLSHRVINLHFKEASVRMRKKKTRGQIKLTQSVHVAANLQTFKNLVQKDYPIHGGSCSTDIISNITMDPLSGIPTMTNADKKAYWGKRLVLAGGACPDDSDDDDNDTNDEANADDADVPAVPQIPINHHCPLLAIMQDLCEGFNVKHVVDFGPTPLNLGFKLAQLGISYVAVCATEKMQVFLKEQAFKSIRSAICDENEPILFDPRFKGNLAPSVYTLATFGTYHVCI
jgi:hypothetical protein